MLHRSVLVLVLVLALALAAPAGAATVPVPADAPAVAPTASGATLLAWVRGGRTCTALQQPGTPRPARASEETGAPGAEDVAPGSCATTPVLARFGVRALGGTSLPSERRRISWGVAGADAATVLFKRGARVLVQAPTTASPLPGAAAELRFWAVEQAAGDPPDEVALADAAGVVRRASAPEDAGLFGDGGLDDEAGTLLRLGRAGGTTWQLRRLTSSALAPTPLAPERRVEQHCVVFATRSGQGGGSSSTGPCDTERLAAAAMIAEGGSDCGVGTHVEALVAPAVRRAVVVTGDGARRALALQPFAAGARVGSLVLGMGVAVRRVVALGAGGRAVATHELRLAPSARQRACASAGISVVFGDDRGPLGPAPAHAVRYADHGVELCSAVDRAPRIPADCALPPTDPAQTFAGVRPTPGGRFLSAVVPAEIAAARVTFDDRTQRTLAAHPLPGYSGIYAGVLREIAADLPGPHIVARVELLDDRGRVLDADAGAEVAYGAPVAVLAAGHGLPVAHAAPLRTSRVAATCVALGPIDDCAHGTLFWGAGAYSIAVQALCSPRRMVVAAVLSHRGDRMVAQTTSGREVAARVARLPAGAGALAGKYYALAVLGPRDGLRSVVLRGRAARRVPASLPPVGRQCGYDASPGLLAALGR